MRDWRLRKYIQTIYGPANEVLPYAAEIFIYIYCIDSVFNVDSNNDYLAPDANYYNDLFNSVNSHAQSNNYNVEQFGNYIATQDPISNMLIINYNIRSFHKNSDEFSCFLSALRREPDILVLTETWLSSENMNVATIAGYEAVHRVRENARSGGVSIFYRDGMKVDKVPDLSISNQNIESCTIDICNCCVTYTVVGVHRPHSGTTDEFIKFLGRIVDSSNVKRNKKNIFYLFITLFTFFKSNNKG